MREDAEQARVAAAEAAQRTANLEIVDRSRAECRLAAAATRDASGSSDEDY